MATITIEVTDLVQRLTAYQDERELSDREMGFLLGVSKNSPHNWRSGRAMTLTRPLQMRIAKVLQISPPEVLHLHGFEISEDIPEGVTVGESGPSVTSAGLRTYRGDVVALRRSGDGRALLRLVADLPEPVELAVGA